MPHVLGRLSIQVRAAHSGMFSDQKANHTSYKKVFDVLLIFPKKRSFFFFLDLLLGSAASGPNLERLLIVCISLHTGGRDR